MVHALMIERATQSHRPDSTRVFDLSSHPRTRRPSMASLHGFKSCLDLTQMLATSMRSCRCAPHPFIRACAQSIGCHSQSESLTLIFAICVSLARSDMDRKTHWGQELFLFGTEQPVSPDSRITGVIEFGYHQVYKYVAAMYMCVCDALALTRRSLCSLARVFAGSRSFRRHVAVDFTFRTSATQYFQKRFAV